MALGWLMRVLAACSFAASCAAADAPLGSEPVDTRSLLAAGKFAQLEDLYVRQSALRQRDADGELQSVHFFHRMGLGWDAEKWADEDAYTRLWLQHSPRSVPAAIARADALSRHASELDRAGQWSKAEAAFGEMRRLLSSVRERASGELMWHTLMVVLARQEGWPLDRVRATIEAGMKVDATSMFFYGPASRALMPDPRQSPDQLAWLARRSAAMTKSTLGMAMYAKVYIWFADRSQLVRTEPFRRGLIDWPAMKQGLTDLHRHEPGDGVLNNRAAMACLARDMGDTRKTLKDLGPRIDSRIWKSWGGDPLVERCKGWAQFGTVTS